MEPCDELVDQDKPKKRGRKSDQHRNVLEADARKEKNTDDDGGREGKRKKKRKPDANAEPGAIDAPPEHEEKRKKRKHKKRSHENAEEDLQLASTGQELRDQGDHKYELLSLDPSSDTSLTEQNCKALCYAYQRFHDPSLWKFNKAKQNWLIRNIWSEQIPEKYVSLVTQYLMGLKGGIRQKLIEECESKIQRAAPDSGSQADSVENSIPTSSIDSRARSLLAALAEQN